MNRLTERFAQQFAVLVADEIERRKPKFVPHVSVTSAGDPVDVAQRIIEALDDKRWARRSWLS